MATYLMIPLMTPSHEGQSTSPVTMEDEARGGDGGFSLTHCLPLRLLPALHEGENEYIVLQSGRLLTGEKFRQMRQELGARILTDEPCRCRRILGFAPGEGGIETEEG